MKVSWLTAIAVIVMVCLVTAVRASENPPRNSDGEELLKLHRELIEAHLGKDVDKLMAPESDEVIRVGRGEVVVETRSERVPRFKDYLENTEFTEYRDLIEPIIRVSDDGTMGWVIAQVRVAGTRRYESGDSKKFDTVWAWIELWEKRDGRWYRIGDVSNAKPE